MIEQAYMGIGEHLGLQDVTPANVKMQVDARLSSEKAGPWLLIIDNADDMNNYMDNVRWLIPRSQNLHSTK